MLAFCFVLLLVINLTHESQSKVNACGPDEFPCNDGSCVDKAEWCDSKLNCDDDSDELYCFRRSRLIKNINRCNQSVYFLCNDGRCIPAVGRCDGYSSCDDNSDEENCTVENTSLVSNFMTSPLPMKQASEWSSLDSKTAEGFYDDESLMQADNVSHTEIKKTNITPVNKFNTSEHVSPSLVLNRANDHKVEETTILANTSTVVSKNFTNDKVNYGMAMNKHALEFRDLIGGLSNTSQNEHNITTNHENSTYGKEVDFKNEIEVPFKNKSHLNIHYADKLNSRQSKDLHKGYVKLHVKDFKKAKEKALHWLIDSKDREYGWGEETARGLIALWMADYSNGRTGDIKLMIKELQLKIFSSMSRNETKEISLGELALYINALSASCGNPKNFFGYDLVNILRHRTNAAQASSKFVSPLVYMVLCLHNASSRVDIIKIGDMLHDAEITKTDIEAVISLAATCISRIPKFSTNAIGQMAAKKLYRKSLGRLPKNIYELALLTQALNEARINQDLWHRTEVMRQIIELQEDNGSFGDILGTYYAVPTLSGKSFLSIREICPVKNTDPTPVEVLLNTEDETRYIQYSLRFGNPLEMSQSLTIKIQKNASFMDIMRIAATINPVYKFKFDVNDGKSFVYSIGGISNDAEKGLYWVPYTSINSTKEFVPFEGDIQKFIPLLEEDVAFWRKSIFEESP